MLFGSNISKTLSVEQFNVNVNWNESVGSFILSNYRDRAVEKIVFICQVCHVDTFRKLTLRYR